MSETTKTGKGKTPPATAPTAPEPASSQPREYVVYRELDITDLDTPALAAALGDATSILVELGTAEAKTAKEARRTVAKDTLGEDELKTEAGVPLRAITKTAANAGRGVAKLKTEPTWAD